MKNSVAGRLPELDEIREAVEREWMAVHKKEVQTRIYSRLRKRYTVVFEEPAAAGNTFQAVSEARAAQEKPQ